MMAIAPKTRRTDPGLVATLTAGVFLAYIITASPHLAHHLFDEDHVSQPCPQLALSHQAPGVDVERITLACPALTDTLGPVPVRSPGLAPDLHPSRPRAPPGLAPLP